MKSFKILALTAVILTSGCMGYSPLYNNGSNSFKNVDVSSVYIVKPQHNIGERRVAQIVKNNLSQMFTGENPEYKLEVSIEPSYKALAVRRDATELRKQVILTSVVSLLDLSDKRVVGFKYISEAAYNVEDSPYGTEAGLNQAESAAAARLSEEIIFRIGMYFNQQKDE